MTCWLLQVRFLYPSTAEVFCGRQLINETIMSVEAVFSSGKMALNAFPQELVCLLSLYLQVQMHYSKHRY